jgi:hypothetical protein
MQGAQKLRSEAHLRVRRNDEVAAQRRRWTFYEVIKDDDPVKSRHPRAGGNPEPAKLLKRLDSRFHGNDGKEHFQTFYEIIKDINL